MLTTSLLLDFTPLRDVRDANLGAGVLLVCMVGIEPFSLSGAGFLAREGLD